MNTTRKRHVCGKTRLETTVNFKTKRFMKKLLMLIAAMLPAFAVMADNVPIFKSSLTTETEFNKWSVINNNNDDATWKYNPDKEAAHYSYAYNIADDWLISPAIKISQPGAYMLKYEYMGSSYGEKMDVFYGNKPETAALNNLVMDLGEITEGDNYITAKQMISINAAQDIYFAFHAKSDPDRFKILVRNVELIPMEGIDVGIDAIKTVHSGYEMGQEDITLTIANYGIKPAKDIEVSYKVNDNYPVVETITEEIAPGAKIDHTFALKADFSEINTYDVTAQIYMEGDELSENNEKTITIKHKGPKTVPYENSFEDTDGIEDLMIYDLNDDPDDEKNGCWSRNKNSFFAMFSRTGDYCMVYFYSKNNPGEDWFILEPIKLKAGYYSLKFWYSSDHEESLSVHYGLKGTPDAMTNEIVRYENFVEPKYRESANVIHIEEDGVYYFGFKAESQPDKNILCVDDFSLTEIENPIFDMEVTGLKSPTNGYLRDGMSQDVVFSVVNNGITDMNGTTIKVAIDGNSVYEETADIKSQETKNYNIKDAMKELAVGTHVLNINIANDLDENAENNSIEYTFKVVRDAKIMYDFETGKVPEEFIIKVADEGTVNPGLKDVFPNNEAWAPIGIMKHPYFGEWMLASASWLEGGNGADRWCILPQMTIGTGDADMMWVANSADSNNKYPETYQVLVSTTDTELSSFTKEVEIVDENYASDPASRGLNLSKYAGKNIYVAFRLVTPDGYFMTLDNIGFYGDVVSTTTGINNIAADGTGVAIENGQLVCSLNNVGSIEIYDMNGQLITSVRNNNSVSVESLQKGVYAARIKADGKVIMHKFSK